VADDVIMTSHLSD